MRLSATLMIGLLAAAAGCGHPSAQPSSTTSQPPPSPAAAISATPVPPHPTIGAVFLGAGDLHTCTGAVLDSTTGDLILTAAHCVADGVDTTFVAGFEDAADPADVWKVEAVYLDPRWVSEHDPQADFAVLRVARDSGGSVEAEAGGGLTLGAAPKPGTVVTVTGYGLGVGGGPIGCQAATEVAPGGFPSFACNGLVDGTSGAPWIGAASGPGGSTIIGLTGGLDGGGCDESVSYSPPFDDRVAALLTRAQAGGPPDPAPAVFDDGC